MRITKLHIENAPPVSRFAAEGLSSRVVIAGPNGVGKTRLASSLIGLLQSPNPRSDQWIEVEATNAHEVEVLGKATIVTSNADDCGKLASLLQENIRRRNIRSSVIQIESNRSAPVYKPFPFTWSIEDPDEESVSWSMGMSTLSSRWGDTQAAIFRKLHALRNQLGGQAMSLGRQGKNVMNLGFSDPMEPFASVFDLLLAPKKLAEPDLPNQKLLYTIPGSDKKMDIATLSSGEREVINVVFDIILRSPEDSIFIFDEPELHLHPELSYKLLRALGDIGKNNQFILFSHSADIISSSLDDTVLFMRPAKGNENQAVKVGSDSEEVESLRLLGQTIGVISLGKRLVLIEGTESSLDKKVYGSLIGRTHPDLVLVPVGGVKNLRSFEVVRDAILNKTIWGVDFFLICDHDATLGSLSEADLEVSKIRRIARYHIENYFLEPVILAESFRTIETDLEWLRDAVRIEAKLVEIAKGHLSYSAALSVAGEVWRAGGNIGVMPKACNSLTEDELVAKVEEMASSERTRVESLLTSATIEEMVRGSYQRMQASLDDGSWRVVIPGKPVMKSFFSEAKIDPAHLKSTYIRIAVKRPDNPFQDIIDIFDRFRDL